MEFFFGLFGIVIVIVILFVLLCKYVDVYSDGFVYIMDWGICMVMFFGIFVMLGLMVLVKFMLMVLFMCGEFILSDVE